MNSSESDQATDQWGRVSEDGSVYVRTQQGERKVGQWPDGGPAEALAFFKKRYDDLAFEVDLLEQRVKAGTLAPDEAAASVKQVRGSIAEAQAVGDLDGLNTRLDALTGTINERREQRKAERAKKVEEAKGHKEKIATEVAAWESKRNALKACIHWTFTLAAARQKLRKLYPSNEGG